MKRSSSPIVVRKDGPSGPKPATTLTRAQAAEVRTLQASIDARLDEAHRRMDRLLAQMEARRG